MDEPLPLASILERLPPDQLTRFDLVSTTGCARILLDDSLSRLIGLNSIELPLSTLNPLLARSLGKLPKLKWINFRPSKDENGLPSALDFSLIKMILSEPAPPPSLNALDFPRQTLPSPRSIPSIISRKAIDSPTVGKQALSSLVRLGSRRSGLQCAVEIKRRYSISWRRRGGSG